MSSHLQDLQVVSLNIPSSSSALPALPFVHDVYLKAIYKDQTAIHEDRSLSKGGKEALYQLKTKYEWVGAAEAQVLTSEVMMDPFPAMRPEARTLIRNKLTGTAQMAEWSRGYGLPEKLIFGVNALQKMDKASNRLLVSIIGALKYCWTINLLGVLPVEKSLELRQFWRQLITPRLNELVGSLS